MADRELLIEHSWLSYREHVLPKDAGSVQLQECRRAFYAGAQGLFSAIMNTLDPGQEATEQDVLTMGLIDAELRRFASKVKTGSA